jgi:hypothetical protein
MEVRAPSARCEAAAASLKSEGSWNDTAAWRRAVDVPAYAGLAGDPLTEVSARELPSRAVFKYFSNRTAGRSSSNSTTTSRLQGRFAAVCGDKPTLWAVRRTSTSDVRPT